MPKADEDFLLIRALCERWDADRFTPTPTTCLHRPSANAPLAPPSPTTRRPTSPAPASTVLVTGSATTSSTAKHSHLALQRCLHRIPVGRPAAAGDHRDNREARCGRAAAPSRSRAANVTRITARPGIVMKNTTMHVYATSPAAQDILNCRCERS